MNVGTLQRRAVTPLLIDVDGTLTRADVTLESLVRFVRSSAWAWLTAILWLLRGRACVKTMLARHAPVDPARLPYRDDVLDLIDEARARGAPVILASASHWRNVRRIARHLGMSEAVIASGRRGNLKGQAKLAAIRDRFGAERPFDYVGDSPADVAVWRAAQQAWTVHHAPRGLALQRLGAAPVSRLKVLVRALRPHQWAKNALVFVPALTSGHLFQVPVMLTALATAAAMSLIASSIYLLNDVLDIDSDRAHRTKWARPVAHGDLSIPEAAVISCVLASAGLAAGWAIGGPSLVACLLVYLAITTAYSWRFKAVMVGDAIVLASLYTIRIWVGGVAIAVMPSFWLLFFSIFLFLSLAYLKRYIEMRDALDTSLLSGRGYTRGDLDVVMSLGIASGMISILVLGLFAHDSGTAAQYAMPQLLWLLTLPLLYWINRIWMMARRGEVDGDPVTFAIRDRRSLFVGGTMVLIFLLALRGLGSGIKA
jgi:4-hydroxybenzoate polyprenyltransferase/phosphoserine phosphatase